MPAVKKTVVKKATKKAQFGEFLSKPDKEGKSTLTTKLNTAAGPRYYQARGFDEGNLRTRNQFRARGESADSTKAANIDPDIIKRLSKEKNGGKTAKAKDGKWMQKVSKSIKARGTEGKCTPITKPGCTGRAKALAKTFKKIAAKRKAK
jgi:hypothetical protein